MQLFLGVLILPCADGDLRLQVIKPVLYLVLLSVQETHHSLCRCQLWVTKRYIEIAIINMMVCVITYTIGILLLVKRKHFHYVKFCR